MRIKYKNILELINIIIQQDNNFTDLNMKEETLQNLIRNDFIYLLSCQRELEFEFKDGKIIGNVVKYD